MLVAGIDFRRLDVAMERRAALVYARPTNSPPHSAFRNLASKTAKRLVTKLAGGADASAFHSFRLVLGEVGRSVAAGSPERRSPPLSSSGTRESVAPATPRAR